MTRNWAALALLFFISINAFGQVIIPADSLKKHVYFLADDSLEGRGMSTPGGTRAANYIAAYFKQIGLKPVGDSYLHPFYSKFGESVMLIGNNVVGVIEGSDSTLKEEYIVLGAHFDHVAYSFDDGVKVIYNGADDNASGTAGIIELGRALIQNKEKLKRSIVIVAFDGEESGLLGSKNFVSQNIVPIKNVKLMMSIDMIGRYAESHSIIMGAMGCLTGGDEMLAAIAEKHDIKIKETGTNISNRTDSKSFGEVGIPALYVTSGIIGPYHKPEDDRETIDYEGMEKISGLLYDLTLQIANSESLVPINKLVNYAQNGGQPIFRYGLKANIGSSHHSYPNEFYSGKHKFSFEAGLLTQLKITKYLSIQPEVMYSTLASDYSTGSFRTHSITTPVSLVLGTAVKKDYNQRFYVNFGGYYSYHFCGSIHGEPIDFDHTFERTETGLVYGIGMEVMSISISVNFKRGLSYLAKDDHLDKILNNATYFSVVYFFK